MIAYSLGQWIKMNSGAVQACRACERGEHNLCSGGRRVRGFGIQPCLCRDEYHKAHPLPRAPASQRKAGACPCRCGKCQDGLHCFNSNCNRERRRGKYVRL